MPSCCNGVHQGSPGTFSPVQKPTCGRLASRHGNKLLAIITTRLAGMSCNLPGREPCSGRRQLESRQIPPCRRSGPGRGAFGSGRRHLVLPGATWSPGSRWAGSRSEAGAGQKGFHAAVSPARRQLGNLPRQPGRAPSPDTRFSRGFLPARDGAEERPGLGVLQDPAQPCPCPDLAPATCGHLQLLLRGWAAPCPRGQEGPGGPAPADKYGLDDLCRSLPSELFRPALFYDSAILFY